MTKTNKDTQSCEMCAKYEKALRELLDVCEELMWDNSYSLDDDSKEMLAMQQAAALIKDDTWLTVG